MSAPEVQTMSSNAFDQQSKSCFKRGKKTFFRIHLDNKQCLLHSLLIEVVRELTNTVFLVKIRKKSIEYCIQ
jgi:hypothetical protein